ncbi:MAG: hypothetical protein HYR90_04130 [Candidatus Andersenbacteria bacterium]|nr:hypothetical protein [Candidatus Andersenbacteria bacterium]MBI3250808.1 hypothetical protein [Candidatus Andersenbacteria bacterium]
MKKYTREKLLDRELYKKPIWDRPSLFHRDSGTANVEDLLYDAEFCGATIMHFFLSLECGRDEALRPGVIVHESVSDRKDELVRYLEELGFITPDWERYQIELAEKVHWQQPKAIHFRYESDKIRDLIDLFYRIEKDRENFKSLKEEKVYFEKKLWKKRALSLPEPLPAGTKWEEIEWRFLNRDEAQIKTRDTAFTVTNAAIGWYNDRTKSKQPDKNWLLLYETAETASRFRRPDTRTIPLVTTRQRRKMLNDALKETFGLHSDPLELGDQGKFYLRFVIIPEVDVTAEIPNEIQKSFAENSPSRFDPGEA